jgi:hypothetical protein
MPRTQPWESKPKESERQVQRAVRRYREEQKQFSQFGSLQHDGKFFCLSRDDLEAKFSICMIFFLILFK